MKGFEKAPIALSLFVTIVALSSGSLALNIEKLGVGIRSSTIQNTVAAQNDLCNIDTPECFEGNICYCNVNENEFLEFTFNFFWIDQPDLPMCVQVDTDTVPDGMTCPTATGIGGVPITCTWTPTYCQAGKYTVVFEIGQFCSNLFFAFDHTVTAHNVNRPPVINATPLGPIETDLGNPVHVDVSATDPDALECTDAANKDVLVLTQMTGPGTFVDNGEGDGDFDWQTDGSAGTIVVTFQVSDGKGGSAETSVVLLANIPAASVWALIVLALGLLTAGTLAVRRQAASQGW